MRNFRNSKILAMGEIQGKLYTVKIVKEHVNIAKQQPDADKYLWHCRFGHLGMNNVTNLLKKIWQVEWTVQTNKNDKQFY